MLQLPAPPFPLGFELLQAMPATLGYLVLGIIVLGLVSAAGFVLARVGIKPLWAVLSVVPFLQVIAIWVFAYKSWPRKPGTPEQT